MSMPFVDRTGGDDERRGRFRQNHASGFTVRGIRQLCLWRWARRCVEMTSRPDDIVLAPYAGSGTTLMAAGELGRKWVGVELKSEFVDLIEQRSRA